MRELSQPESNKLLHVIISDKVLFAKKHIKQCKLNTMSTIRPRLDEGNEQKQEQMHELAQLNSILREQNLSLCH